MGASYFIMKIVRNVPNSYTKTVEGDPIPITYGTKEGMISINFYNTTIVATLDRDIDDEIIEKIVGVLSDTYKEAFVRRKVKQAIEKGYAAIKRVKMWVKDRTITISDLTPDEAIKMAIALEPYLRTIRKEPIVNETQVRFYAAMGQ